MMVGPFFICRSSYLVDWVLHNVFRLKFYEFVLAVDVKVYISYENFICDMVQAVVS